MMAKRRKLDSGGVRENEAYQRAVGYGLGQFGVAPCRSAQNLHKLDHICGFECYDFNLGKKGEVMV